jgi:hypothetical protein
VSSQEKEQFAKGLKIVKAQLNGVNERRNNVVHSTYLEVEHMDYSVDLGLVPRESVIEAIKPFLHRRAVEGSEEFYKTHAEVEKESISLTAEIRSVYQNVLTFDRAIIACTNWMWDDFCERATEQRKSETNRV